MNLAEGIRKHGFRKWYERELMQSHAHMLLLLFCTIGLLGAFEVFNRAAQAMGWLKTRRPRPSS